MKPIGTTVIITLGLTMLACTRSPTPDTETYPTSFNDGGVPAQNRISAYLESSVIPKLRGCWSQLQGEGAMAMDVSYRKSGGDWAFEKLAVKKSTLLEGQDAVAQTCTERSVQATSFPVDRGERLEMAAEQFVVRLNVPVPLPAEGSQLTSEEIGRMVGGSGESGDVPGCSECVSRSEYPYGLKCETKASGGHLDCREHSSNVCSTAPTACLRGLFSGATGVIMY